MKRLMALGVAVAALSFVPAAFAQTNPPTSQEKAGAGGLQPYSGGASTQPNNYQTEHQQGAGGFQPYAGGASAKPNQQTSGDATATPPKQ